MKSTRVFKILSIALAAAVVFYFLVQGVRYLTNPYATTRVYTSTTEDAVEASGLAGAGGGDLPHRRRDPESHPGGGGEGGPGPGHCRHL